MKRVLVISDNPDLAEALAHLINVQSLLLIAKFDYRYSKVNSLPEPMVKYGYTPIDLKNSETIAWVVSSFDLVISIHCKQIFPTEVVAKVCCINVHPGFNPHNRGWYPQVFSIINKKPIGATIHIMNQEIDAGPIIAQQQVEVSASDTSLSLYEKVRKVEISLLNENIVNILRGNISCSETPKLGNYNSVSNFKNLCHLDLAAVGTLQEHIDLLRALSHGEFKNAYFIDEGGLKIYVNVQLTPAEDK